MGSAPSREDHEAAWKLFLAAADDGNVERIRAVVDSTWELAQRTLRAELAAALRSCELSERQSVARHEPGTQNRALHVGAKGAYGWAATLVEGAETR